MTAVPQPDPDPWGLQPAPPSPPPADAEIGLTADEDGWTPNPDEDMPFGRFLAILALAAMTTVRRHGARTRIHYGRNRRRI